jgi:hypothetical protein
MSEKTATMSRVVLAVAAVTVCLAGCGTLLGAPPQPSAASSPAPPPSPAVPAAAASPTVTATCQIGYTPVDEPSPFVVGPAPSTSPGVLAWDYPSVQVQMTAPASDNGPVSVNSITVVYYTETGSGDLPVGEVIVPGQTMATVPVDGIPSGAAACQVVSWAQG